MLYDVVESSRLSQPDVANPARGNLLQTSPRAKFVELVGSEAVSLER